MELRRFLVILTIALVIILNVVVWFFPSNDDFRTENQFWNGTKNIISSDLTSTLESLSDLPRLPQGSTLILIPYVNFTSTELEELNNFVNKGGNLVLADDYGYGNQVLQYLGTKVRFSGQPLLDPVTNYTNQWFPQIFHLTSNPITANVERLVFNHATALTDVEIDDALALSSSFSFIDLNNDRKWQEGEPIGPLPVISRHYLGSGQIILLSDPSLFINSMETMESNDKFIQNIAAITKSNLLIDQSHLPPSNLHQAKNLLTYIRSSLITPWGTLGLVILTLTITLMPLWHERRRH